MARILKPTTADAGPSTAWFTNAVGHLAEDDTRFSFEEQTNDKD
jgi:hypothetical protein